MTLLTSLLVPLNHQTFLKLSLEVDFDYYMVIVPFLNEFVLFASVTFEKMWQGYNWALPNHVWQSLFATPKLGDHNEICLCRVFGLVGSFFILGFFRSSLTPFLPQGWAEPSGCWQRVWSGGSAQALIVTLRRNWITSCFGDGILRRRREQAGSLTITLRLIEVGLSRTTHNCSSCKCGQRETIKYFLERMQ